MKKMKFMKRMLIFTLLPLALSQGRAIHAKGAGRIGPIDSTQECSMEIELSVEDEENIIVISEMPIKIYRVATLSETNGLISYNAIAPFDIATVDYTRLADAESSAKAARQLKEHIDAAEGIAAVTNTLGVAKITNIEMGIYLVVPIEETNGYLFEPFLVSVPFLQEDAREENIWVYQVKAKPKAANRMVEVPEVPVKIPEPHPNKEGKPVPTGDESDLQFWVSMIGISILGICCVVAVKKKNAEK